MIKVLINQHIKNGDIIMMKNEYKLVPKKEIINLKKEVQDLKKSSMQGKVKTREPISSKGLKESMDNLSEAINELVNLFTVAKEIGQEGNIEEPKQDATNLEQNRAIAAGILAITQILKEYLPKLVHISKESPKYKILRIKKSTKLNPYNPMRSSTETTSDFSESNPPISGEEDSSQN